MGAVFKGADLREQCVVETIWTVYMTEPSESLYINFQDSGGWVQRPTHPLAAHDKPHMYIPLLINCHLPVWNGLFLQSLLVLHV